MSKFLYKFLNYSKPSDIMHFIEAIDSAYRTVAFECDLDDTLTKEEIAAADEELMNFISTFTKACKEVMDEEFSYDESCER